MDINSWPLATSQPKGAYPKALEVGSGPFVQRILCPGNLKQNLKGMGGALGKHLHLTLRSPQRGGGSEP